MNNSMTSFWMRFALPLSILLVFTPQLMAQTQQATLVKDINVGTASSKPTNIISLGNKIVFTANDGFLGNELYASDGTAAGTALIKEFVASSGEATLSRFVALNGVAYFIVNYNETPQHIELWKTGGTSATTTRLINLSAYYVNVPFLTTNDPFIANNAIYFEVSRSLSPSQEVVHDVWRTDGVTTANVGVSSSSFQNTIVPTYYYGANQPIFAVNASNSCSSPLSFGNIVVFDANGVHAPVPFGSSTSPGACFTKFIGVMGQHLYFIQAATVNPTATTKATLYKMNTEGVKTVVVDSFGLYGTSNIPLETVVTNSWVYFFWNSQMWKSDGTTSGTLPITNRNIQTEPFNLFQPFVDGEDVYFGDVSGRFRNWRVSNGSSPTYLFEEETPFHRVSYYQKVGTKIYSFATDILSTSPTTPRYLMQIKSIGGATAYTKITETRQIDLFANNLPNIGVVGTNFLFAMDAGTQGLELGNLNVNATLSPCDTDRIAPVLSNCPQNINLTTTGTSAVATWITPTATDNCTTTPSVSSNYASGSPFGIGTTAVTYTATDAKNNTATCRFNVSVAQVVNSCRQSDSLQLVSLYNATNGAGWTNKWNLNAPISTWYGVTLNANGCVQKIIMPNNRLTGSLPNLNLSQLEQLVVNDMFLSGSIPNFNLPNLQVLNLNYTTVSGVIPNFNLPNLRELSLYSTQLSGQIPNFNLPNLEILRINSFLMSSTIPNFSLPKLKELNLSGSKLTGTIPLFNTPFLELLFLNNNQLTGTIPNFSYPNLRKLALSTNLLTGTIPTFNCPSVTTLMLNNNQLTGTIPNFNFPNLDTLYLYTNQLTGSIPNFTQLSLKDIDLATNQLTGGIPNFNLPNLQALRLDNNPLGGSIPNFNLPSLKGLYLTNVFANGTLPDFNGLPNLLTAYFNKNFITGNVPNFNLPNIGILVLADNSLSGSIPNFDKMPKLYFFYLSNNQLSGTIPNFINTPLIQTLGLNNNQFTGSIPDFVTPNLYVLYLYNNQLTGCIPSSFKFFCGKNVIISPNPNLINQDLTTFCNNDIGLCNNACATDVTPPVLTNCPQNMTVNTTSTAATVTWTTPTATDNCTTTPSVSSNYASGSSFGIGTTAVIYTATDAKNNTATCSFTINVVSQPNGLPDLFESNLILLNNPVAAGDTLRLQSSYGNIGSAPTSPTVAFHKGIFLSTDAVLSANDLQISKILYGQFPVGFMGINTSVYIKIPSTVPAGLYYVISKIDVDDVQLESSESNNIAVSAAQVSVTNPVVSANCVSKSNAPWSEWIANVTLANLNNATSKTRDDRFVVGYSDWTDKSAAVLRSQTYPLSITPGLSWSAYQTNLFFRAWIDFNNNGIYEDTELVLEKNSISAAVNQSITIPATAFLGTVKMRVSMKKDAYPTACETFAAGEVEDYSIVIANGTNPCSTDVTPPVFFNCPANINQTITGTSAIIIWAAPNVTDNCTVPPSLSSNYNSGSTFSIGTTTVIYTARDAANNSATCSFTVTVSNDPCASDVTPPVLSGVPANVTVNCWGNIPTVIHPTATDNCSTVSQINVVFQEVRNSLILKRTWTATDARGNASTATQTITVLDNVAPVFTGCPQNISVTTTGACEVVPWNAPASVSDNCGSPDVVYTPNIGTCFPIGTHTVKYVATDGAGNQSTCSFTITVSGSNTGTCKKYTAASTNSICNPATWQPYLLRIGTDRYVAETIEFKETSAGTATLKGTLRSPTWQAVPIDLTFSGKTTTGTPQKINCLTPSVSTANWAYYPTVSGTIGLPTGTANITTLSNALQIGTGANTQDVNTLGGYAKLTNGATSIDLAFKLANEMAVTCEGGTNSCANNALNFDGVDDYLQTPQYFIPANSNFTLEASFTSTATTTICSGYFKRLLSLELSNSSNRLEIGDCAGQLTLFYFIANGNAKLLNIAGATNLRDGNWHHVAAVKNGDILTLYYDGVLVLTEAGLQNINNVARELYVGRWAGGGDEYWQGNVDEVRVWNYAVAATDITNRRNCQLSGTESGLILYYPFNQGVSGGVNTTIANAMDKSSSNLATPLSNFAKQGSTSNFVCSTQTLSQGCTTTDPCAADVTPPVFQNCPQNISLTTTTTIAAATWTIPTATDNCTTTPSVTSNYTSGQSFSLGSTTVIYTARDAKNNSSTCSFNIVVTNSTTNAADLELSISATPATYRQWTTNTVRVTAKNIGSTTLTNIKIELKRPDKMAFGGTKTPSVGVFNDYCAGGLECSEWHIQSLAAGTTATLDAPFFVLDAVAPIVATTRLLSSTPTDGNVANNTASVSIAPQTLVAQTVSKPTQLIPIVIQSLAPNPTDGELRILLESLDEREVSFDFYNALGEIIMTETKKVKKGANSIDFMLYNFGQGVFYVTPRTHLGRNVPTKFVKL